MLPQTPSYHRSGALKNHIPTFVHLCVFREQSPLWHLEQRLSPPMWFDSAQTRCSSEYNNLPFSVSPSQNIFQTGLPAGVYMLVRHNGSKAVLIVKAEPSEATVRVFSEKQASTSLRTFTSANPAATAVRTVLPKIIKPVQFVIKPTIQEVSSSTTSSSSGLTCYGTTKASGTKTLRRVVPQPQKYQTPLQVVSLLGMILSLDHASLSSCSQQI